MASYPAFRHPRWRARMVIVVLASAALSMIAAGCGTRHPAAGTSQPSPGRMAASPARHAGSAGNEAKVPGQMPAAAISVPMP